MANDAYFFDDGVLTVTNSADSSETPLAGLQGITVTPEYELQQLYTADSTFREEAKQHSHNVNVDIDYSVFDIATAKQWLGGEGTTAATSSTDTSDPAQFKVEVVQASADGSLEKTVEVAKVIFPDFPLIDGSQGEFEEYGLSGSGRTVANLDETSGA